MASALEGGEITAYLSCKGDGVTVEVPEDAKDWLSISAINSGAQPTVTFRAAANNGGDRSTTVVFKTSSDGKEYTSEVSISQKGAIVAATVADFSSAPVGDTQYRLTVSSPCLASDKYGNVYLRRLLGRGARLWRC